jgi:hypothetical protein
VALARRPRCWLAAVALAIGSLAGLSGAAAAAPEYGISDGRPALFDAPQVREVNFTRVRLVLPWNAAYHEGTWTTWLQRAELQGYPVLIAPTIDAAHDCETGTCSGPSQADYRSALSALLALYPGIDSVEAWNEPNHALQPTSHDPAAAAGYFNTAADLCTGRCIAVAGNLLDAPGFGTYLSAYKAALTTTPAVWGLHNYYDATYFQSTGVDTMLANTSGPLWLTETGGLVSFTPDGASALPADEHRAADSLRWLFTLVQTTPRIQRMYLYMLWQQTTNGFDSALLRADNSERESMAVVRAYVGPRQQPLTGVQAPAIPPFQGSTLLGSTPKSLAEAAAKLGLVRLSGKRVVLPTHTRRLSLLARCFAAQACRNRLQVRVGAWNFTRSFAVAARSSKRLRLRLPRAVAAGLARRPAATAWARVCPLTGTCISSPRLKVVRR